MHSVFFGLLRNDLKSLLSTKVVVFWNLVFPFFLLTVMLLAFGSRGGLGHVDVDVLDQDGTAASSRYVSGLGRLTFGDAVAMALHPLRASEAASPPIPNHVRLLIPHGFSASPPDERRAISIAYDYNGSAAVKTVAHAIGGFTHMVNLAQAAPLTELGVAYANTGAGSGQITYAQYVLAGVLVMVMMSSGIMTTSVALAGLRELDTFKVYACMPMHKSTFLLAFLSARALVAVTASLILLAGGHFIFAIPIDATPLHLLNGFVLILLGTAMFLAMGMTLGARVSSIGEATLISNLVYFPLFFLGDLTIPLHEFPPLAKRVLSFVPVHDVVASLRAVLFLHASPQEGIGSEALILGWTIVFFLSVKVLFRWNAIERH